MQNLGSRVNNVSDWPDYCCVAALIEDAAKALDVRLSGDRGDLARAVQTTVPAGAPNPLRLPESVSPESAGVLVSKLEREWPPADLQGLANLGFEIVRATSMNPSDFPDSVARYRRAGYFVGAGVDYGYLYGLGEVERRHVVRLHEVDSRRTYYFDPTEPSHGERSVATKEFWESMAWRGDGLWLFWRLEARQDG